MGWFPTLHPRIQYSFATFFVLELILRICADGRRFFCGEDWKWSWLDIFVVRLEATSVRDKESGPFISTKMLGGCAKV